MRRACRVTLKFSTAAKRRRIRALVTEYRAAVNVFIRRIWKNGGAKLNKETLDSLPDMHLTQRLKSQCLKQALEIVVSTKKSAKALKKKCSRPVFRGWPVLDAKFVGVEPGRKSFDLVVKVSTLKKGRRVVVPTRRTSHLNKWLEKPGAKLIQGCELRYDTAILWVELPDLEPEVKSVKEADPSKVLGLDIGVTRLLVDSNGNEYGTNSSEIYTPLKQKRRRRRRTRARTRARNRRDAWIEETINSLPWGTFKVLVVEDIRDIKRGRKKNRGRSFRRSVAPWRARRVLARIGHRCEENRVLFVTVPPAHTSQACPICGGIDKRNRSGTSFRCVGCGHTADADFVGATNIRWIGLGGSLESPQTQRF